jgi:glycosyltransferase involved in cell wall biosynthesis
MRTDKPRVLMFAPFCYPPAGAEAIVTAKLLLAALDAGWDIDVISQKNAGQFYPYSINGIWKPITDVVKNIDTSKGFELFKRLQNAHLRKVLNRIQSLLWVEKAFSTARRLSIKKKYDFILSRVSPQYGHLPALLVSQKLKIPWIANWNDPMPPQKSPYPYGDGPFAYIPIVFKKYIQAVSRQATWHTFPSERMRNYICSYLPDCKEKSSIIPHIALERLCYRSSQRQKGFTLCHIGDLGLRKPDIFLEGVKRFFYKTRPEGHFFVKFASLKFDNLKELSRNLGIEHLVIMESAKTYEETQKIAENSTVLVVIEADLEEGIFFPSKFVDLVQTGRPILAVSPAVGTLNDIILQYGGGIAVDCKSPDDVAKAIQLLYFEWEKGTLDEKFSSKRLFDLFSEKRVIEKYIEIFKHIKSRQNNIR